MSDIKLFRLSSGSAVELRGDASDLEKPLQTLIERNLEVLLGIRFLATEYATGKKYAGRIDSLGLDENDCPVILEYKRSVGENVINQGLFYLDWLMDHKAEFEMLAMKKLGSPAAAEIDWSAPRLVCVAADFTKYDGHAVQQINRNIELIRYRRFGEDLLLLELANVSSAGASFQRRSSPLIATAGTTKEDTSQDIIPTPKRVSTDKTVAEHLITMPPQLATLLASLEDYLLSLGDDVQRKELKLYIAYKKLKNFATVVPQRGRLLLYLHLDVDQIAPPSGIGRSVRNQGHWGTGDMEIALSNDADLDSVKPLIQAAYERGGAIGTPPDSSSH